MSQFSLETELSNVLRMDGPINRGPAMRWQRKNDVDCNASLNASCGPSKTPVKSASNKSLSKTPSSGESVGFKTPKSGGKFLHKKNKKCVTGPSSPEASLCGLHCVPRHDLPKHVIYVSGDTCYIFVFFLQFKFQHCLPELHIFIHPLGLKN